MERRPLTAINITPLVDVLLILVAILILAMPLAAKKLPVNLPDTTLAAQFLAKNRTQVVIYADGRITLEGKDLLLTDLKTSLKSGATIEIAADESVRYAIIAKVIDAVHSSNPAEIQLIVK